MAGAWGAERFNTGGQSMATQKLSQQDMVQLETGLKKLVTGGAPPAAGFAPSGVQEEFCSIWPKAEPIIKEVAKYIIYIPGVGPAAGAILNGLADAGDAVAKAVCPKTSGG